MAQTMDAAIAANRFGLGARPGELARIGSDPEAWLRAQIDRPQSFQLKATGLPSAKEAAEALDAYREDREAAKMAAESAADPAAAVRAAKPMQRSIDFAAAEAVARFNHALLTDQSFAERLVLFWSNALTVSANKLVTIPFAGVYERDVIRAGMTGTFAAMLLASARHPGMLLYLDQAQSIGPNSEAGRRRDAGLNENLAREILELHTLGPQGGYSQADVTEFAKALTGWTLAGQRTRRFAPDAQPGAFVFVSALHEPGARTVLGKRYGQDGEAQARAIMLDLAAHPATARNVATKLARHFVADDPPASAIAPLEKAFIASGGALPALHRALIDLPEARGAAQLKYKTPNEFIISAMRMIGAPSIEGRALQAAHTVLGQPPLRAPSPKGWPDDAASWAGADAVIKRLEWSQAFAERVGERARPEALAEGALGSFLSEQTRRAIRLAESGAQGLVLALMSPKFQRR